MRGQWMCALLLAGATACCAAAGGDPNAGWLKKVPASDRDRTNPYAGQADAIAAGKNIFSNACARCHGTDGQGRKGRPALASGTLHAATDGEIQWLIKNGEPYRGMPSWGGMPQQQRWQLVAWLRSLNNTGEGK